MRVAALGRTQMLAEAARALDDHEHDVVLVIAPRGPRHRADAMLLRQLADELACPFLEASNLGAPEVVSAIALSAADVGVSVNWPTIVPPEALEAFTHGVLNAHAGDLPRYRGNATLAWAILNGEAEMVLTVHQMDAGLDTGPVLAKRAIPIDEATYVGDLYAQCERLVPEMFVEVLAGLAAGSLTPSAQEQSPEASLRCFPRRPEDGWIDWSKDARSIARVVRASAEPFGGAYTLLEDTRLTIWRARDEELPYPHLGVPGQVVEMRGSGEVAILAGSGVLVLERVQLADGPSCTPAEVLRSMRLRVGLDLSGLLESLQRRVGALELQAVDAAARAAEHPAQAGRDEGGGQPVLG